MLVCLDFASFCCLAGLLCCLAQGCSWSGIPTSSSKRERFILLHFLIPGIYPSYLLQLQCSFYLELGCVVGCSKGGSHRAIYGLIFHCRGSLSIGGSIRRALGNIYIILASGQPSTIPHSAFKPELRYFWRQLLGGFIELIRRVYFWVEGSAFY